ncbi:hypothetical protein Gohar_007864 [Gossypium harknessii]|uniref:Uncharacterized protein n=2 Tax=Gossypium TaxID=3633 RepID=A0A7J8X156_GOSAI|nr:hypothetical protein [Gossypium aridum]MBA0797142.1 hypothetical protein [Gossypium harknessii]
MTLSCLIMRSFRVTMLIIMLAQESRLRFKIPWMVLFTPHHNLDWMNVLVMVTLLRLVCLMR